MERTLLLSSLGFPSKFNSVNVSVPNGLKKQAYVEQQVLKSINIYNSKLNVTKIEYADIESQFPKTKTGMFTGFIVEEFEIQQDEEDKYKRKDYFVWNDGIKWFVRKIVIYVFLSDYANVGRNVFCQAIFPELIDYMPIFLSSPSYTIVNHPIYFINIMNEATLPFTFIKQIASMVAIGFEYIEVFTQLLKPNTVPMDIEGFVKNYEENCINGNSTFCSEDYEVDFDLEKLIVKADKFAVGEYLNQNGSKLDFKGSSEKFYWIKILPMIILACSNGYDVDYSNLEKFYDYNVNNFSSRSVKIKRFEMLIQYIKKITLS